MKNLFLTSTMFFILISFSRAQEIVSSTFLLTYDLEHFNDELEISFSKYGVDLYRVTYTTKDLEGALDTASGLVCIPKVEDYNLPLISYAHGTVASRYDVPSFLSIEHNLPSIYSSMGAVCIAPDYLGLGVNEGIHPYVHAASEAWASFDLLVAVKDFLSDMQVQLNDQLYLTGYSQGGHAAMALHRYLETETDIEVDLSIPMSGPYSISTGMKDLLISENEYQYVAYLASTAVSYQEVYGTIFPNNDITQFFKQPYADIIQKFVNNEADLLEINEELIASLVELEGGSFPKKMVQDDLLDAILTDDNHPVNIALRDNDVYDWAPKADTRLLYCQADDQVNFQNSLIARDKMVENGATQVTATDLNSNFDHSECVTPAATSFVLYLLVFGSPTSDNDLAEIEFNSFPNPTRDGFHIVFDSFESSIDLEILSLSGIKEMDLKNLKSGDYIDTNLASGIYILNIKDTNGKSLGLQKLIIQ